MKVITLNKFKKIIYTIFGILSIIVLLGMFLPININISSDTINNKINDKIPLTINKDIKIPLTNHVEHISIKIIKNNVIFKEDLMNTNTNGIIYYKDKKIKFITKTFGKELYYDRKTYSFYFKPKEIKVVLNKQDIDNIFTINKIPVVKEEKKKSFFSKFSNPFKKNKEESPELTINSNGLSFKIPTESLNKFKNKAVVKYNKAIEDGLKDNIIKVLTNTIEYSVVKALDTFPVYKLKEKELDSKAKLFLNGVTIKNNQLIIEFSTINLVKSSILFIISTLFLFLLLEILSRNVKKQEKVTFLNLFDVVLVVTEVGLDTLGAVAEVGLGAVDI